MSSCPFDLRWFCIEEPLSRCLNRKEPSLQHWIDLLSISTKYQLESIRPIAINGIDTYRPEIDPVQKYALATKYMVEEWKRSSFKMLCRRSDALTVEEAIRLGVIVATEVFREREKIRSMSDTTNKANFPQPVIGSMKPPRGPGTAPVPTEESGPSNVSQSNPISAATATEPVPGPVAATSTSSNSKTVKPTSLTTSTFSFQVPSQTDHPGSGVSQNHHNFHPVPTGYPSGGCSSVAFTQPPVQTSAQMNVAPPRPSKWHSIVSMSTAFTST